MATTSDDNAGKFVVANATPFLWKQSGMKDSGMSSWRFPREVKPGETFTATVAFEGGQGAHGEVTYQAEIEEGVSGDGNPAFSFLANKDGLTVVLPPAIRRDAKWFACPPAPFKLAEVGWQKGCTVSFTLGAEGGDHPNLRGGHTARNFHGLALAAPNSAPASSGEHRDGRGDVFPRKGSSSSGASSDRAEGGGGLGGFFGAVGGLLKAATDGVGGLLNDCGIGDQARPGGGEGEGNWTVEWMKRYSPALQDLKLADMSIPGTHDSGTAKMHNPVVGPWASTQHLGLTQQLQAGVRCLDFRVGFVGAEVQRKDKIKDGVAVVHDKYRTTLSLRDALTAVKKFVQGHPTEVVLLDFHRFPGLGHGPPHEKAAKVVLETLGDVMIHPKHRNLPFGKLVSNQRGRIAVLWNAVEARNPSFWPGVKQAWNGGESLSALHQLATTELATKKGAPWSMPLVLPAGVPRPVPHIPEDLDEWIAVGGIWQENANILAVDFVEETQLVRNCVGACMLKAARHSAASPAPSHGGGGGGNKRGAGGGGGHKGGGGGHKGGGGGHKGGGGGHKGGDGGHKGGGGGHKK